MKKLTVVFLLSDRSKKKIEKFEDRIIKLCSNTLQHESSITDTFSICNEEIDRKSLLTFHFDDTRTLFILSFLLHDIFSRAVENF